VTRAVRAPAAISLRRGGPALAGALGGGGAVLLAGCLMVIVVSFLSGPGPLGLWSGRGWAVEG
jgi:hypothetical protein